MLRMDTGGSISTTVNIKDSSAMQRMDIFESGFWFRMSIRIAKPT